LHLVGRITFVNKLYYKTSFGAFMGCIRAKDNMINPVLLNYFLKSSYAKEFFKSNANTTTNISNLNFKTIGKLKLPVPPIETQNQIVEELNSYQKIIDGCRQVIENYKPSIDIDPSWEMVELRKLPIKNLDSKRKPISKNERVRGDVPYYGSTQIKDYVKDFIFDERLLLIGEDGAKWGPGEKTSFIIEGKSWVNNHIHVLQVDNSKISDVYLSALINMMDLNNYISGAVVPKLTQQSLNNILIPLPNFKIQKNLEEKILDEQVIIDGNKKILDIFSKKITDKINKIWSN